MKKTYILTEKAEVTRVYEIEAENEEQAREEMYSGNYDPISSTDEVGEIVSIETK